MPDIHLTPCPKCRAVNLVHPGQPPGSGTNYLNRCTAHALTGHPGRGGRSNYYGLTRFGWWPPTRHDSRLCGEPLTTPAGEIRPPLPFDLFMALTRRPFDPADL